MPISLYDEPVYLGVLDWLNRQCNWNLNIEHARMPTLLRPQPKIGYIGLYVENVDKNEHCNRCNHIDAPKMVILTKRNTYLPQRFQIRFLKKVAVRGSLIWNNAAHIS